MLILKVFLTKPCTFIWIQKVMFLRIIFQSPTNIGICHDRHSDHLVHIPRNCGRQPFVPQPAEIGEVPDSMEMAFTIHTQEPKQWKWEGNEKSHQGTHQELSPWLCFEELSTVDCSVCINKQIYSQMCLIDCKYLNFVISILALVYQRSFPAPAFLRYPFHLIPLNMLADGED